MNSKTKWFFIGILGVLALSLLSTLINAIPTGPGLTYISNSTAPTVIANRSVDEKGQIIVININSNQQDYKWKAYVGNVSGRLALDDSNAKSIYDWTLSTTAGEVYATRQQAIVNWNNVTCVNQSVIYEEEALMSMSSGVIDNINRTFNYTAHRSFLLGSKNITSNSCRSTATYINDTPQTVDESAFYQELLMMDTLTGNVVYTTFIDNDHLSFNGADTFDFQMLIAENESSTVPTMYFFYLELG